MKNIYKFLILGLIISFGVNAQNKQQRTEIINEQNKDRVVKTQSIITKLHKERQQRINQYIATNNITDKSYIHKIYDIKNGEPILRSTENTEAAKFTKTNAIQPGGNLNLNLEGEGYEVGVWDENATMLTHVEFNEGVSSRVSKGDMTFGTSGHATHVGGTIAASGVNPDAKGMASKVALTTYDWNSDDIEASEAANNGLLISNHSYGVPVFDNQGTQVSSPIRVGAYVENSYVWDLIPYTYEFYLPVVSAGNDGGPENSDPVKPTYDKLNGNKTSKNLMIVANSTNAIYAFDGSYLSDPFINNGSSEGPTDDGRVKPDITGMGTGLLSSFYSSNEPNVNNYYAQSTGTSMSAPNVAGTLILLQELHNNEHNEFLKNYELKNLAIHNAYDPSTSSPGPDPKFGWGILDAQKCAETIIDKNTDQIVFDQLTLNEGESITIELSLQQAKDFKASIVWNDVPGLGSPDNYQGNFAFANDETPALINDLDIKLTNNSTLTEYLPWALDMSNATITAIKTDNVVDNVEKIEEDQLAAGNYTLTISHKNNLENTSQDFSLIVTGIDSFTTLSNTYFKESAIAIWPNPVKDQLNITNTHSFDNEISVSIYDLGGRLIKQQNNTEMAKTINIDTSSLKSGVYLVNITDGQNNIQKKIIKK